MRNRVRYQKESKVKGKEMGKRTICRNQNSNVQTI